MSYDANQPTRDETVTIVNITPSESCFGIVIGSGCGVFFPASISIRAELKAGDLLQSRLIDNPVEASRSRTPFMAVYAKKITPYPSDPAAAPQLCDVAPIASKSADDARQFTYNLLMAGGCWNNLDVFCSFMNDENARRGDHPVAYAAIGNELRRMFADDVASKFTLYRTGSQTRASAEWFTTTPDQCEPMDWSEEDA